MYDVIRSAPALDSHFLVHQDLLAASGVRLFPTAHVLDFGCGSGQMVERYGQAGYHAFGCDPSITEATDRVRLMADGRIPFPDNFFDLVFSDQVLEHVGDHALAIREIARVTKPGGVSLHIFPSRLRVLEPHVFVPGATLLKSRRLTLGWVGLLRKLGKSTFSPQDAWSFLQSDVHYASRSTIRSLFQGEFARVDFVEGQLLRHGQGRSRLLGKAGPLLPLVSRVYSSFWMHVVLAVK